MTTIFIILILLIIAFLLWLILANRKPSNKPNYPIATYTQNGVIHNGSLRKGCQRPNN
jgi:hypothetical protein